MFSGKNLPLFFLIGLVFLSAAAATVFAIMWARNTGEMRALQQQAASVERNRTFLRALAGDVLDYSKKNPAIDPILQAAGLKAAPGPAKTK